MAKKRITLKDGIKEKVTKLLTEYPHLRDDDNKLIANIWTSEMGGSKYIKTITGFDAMHFIASSQLTSSESIRRTRQKIQEHNVTLRGKSYKNRKDNQDPIKDQLDNF
jgi:deoxyribose-phosphate aldolase